MIKGSRHNRAWGRRAFLMTPLLVILLNLGCGEDEVTAPVPTLLPENTTPAGTIARFIALYENQNATEYARLFTGDFLFEFSNSADPDLANEYLAGWFKADEEIAATNLFQGGVNNDGVLQPGAQTITLHITRTSPVGDTLSGRDSTVYKVLFTPVTLEAQLPPDENDPEGPMFIVGGANLAVHRFFLVRGDMANGLDKDQPADSMHWYIWFWRDESTVPRGFRPREDRRSSGVSAAPRSVEDNTWGQIKGIYR
jgi:hypothetical protein